ncbi:MAG: tRNA (adenosine(37)-N6)-dimethylallyltransferase MiaA [Candidatus Omnitrophota bacterium]
MSEDKVIFIIGPTAVGKTGLAIKLAKKIKGEIISADSMQAYGGMGIVSQKPTRPELRQVKHHLVDFIDPGGEYSAAIFSKMAKEKIKDIIKRRKVPIVVGGSGLYIKALIDGIFPSRGKDALFRQSLEISAREKGLHFLYDRLNKADPLSAKKIHPNDKKRIIRALEIFEVDKKTKTSLRGLTEGIADKYVIKIFGLNTDRTRLYKMIEERVDRMFKRGIVKEVKGLSCRRLGLTAGHALGVKQVMAFLDKNCSIDEARNALKRDTRRFAKRQLTWFRADKRIVWLDIGELGMDRTIEEILRSLSN